MQGRIAPPCDLVDDDGNHCYGGHDDNDEQNDDNGEVVNDDDGDQHDHWNFKCSIEMMRCSL